ncbi:MAG: SDR family oxidoreductase [Solirubrobacterales bacterium]|nr:SDR family oxidoreductase [Solirubrobacterales bacterium]
MELEGTTGLLTGAAGGLGSAMARRLAGDGVRLVLSGRNEAALGELCESLPGEGHAVVTTDLGERDAAKLLIAEAEATAGPIDLLVNNAGIETAGTYHRLEASDIERIVDINLLAPMLLTHAVIPGMLDRGRGHVVQISSAAGFSGLACNEPYAATKGALLRLTEALRATYADQPIGFSAVCPGFTKGDGMYGRMEEEGHHSNVILGTTTVQEVADAVSRSVTDDLAVTICNNRPLRPIAAISVLAPGLGARMLETSGANAVFRRIAAERES